MSERAARLLAVIAKVETVWNGGATILVGRHLMFRSCESIDQAPHGCWIDGTGDQRQPDECRETWTHRIAAPLAPTIPVRPNPRAPLHSIITET
jgi:hypothetical protein